jgi:hypothetical protein
MGPLIANTSLQASMSNALSHFADLLSTRGYTVKVDSVQAWRRFEASSRELQEALIHRFQSQLSMQTELSENGVDFRDPVQSVWRILSKFNWKPPHDLFDRIHKNDVVEIFLPDHTQLYRNLNYFNFTSYSLTELLFYPWDELFEHQEGFHAKLAENVGKVFVQQSALDYHEMPGPYLGREKFSAERLSVKLQCKAFSPLKNRNTGTNEALIIVWSMERMPENHHSQHRTPGRKLHEEEISR